MTGRPFEVRVLDTAAEELRKLDRSVVEQIVAKLNWLAQNADQVRHRGLSGPLAPLCRLRSGDYRILYELLIAERLIIVHAVGHRRDIYRRV